MKNLNNIRIKKGLTQKELAKLVGISQNYISEIENGNRSGSINVCIKIAKVLEVSLDALTGSEVKA